MGLNAESNRPVARLQLRLEDMSFFSKILQQCSLQGLRVPEGPSRVTDQPDGWTSHKFFPPEYEINDN